MLCNPPLNKRLDPIAFKNTRSALLAGATVPEAVTSSWQELFPNIPIREAMGATEATAMTMCQDLDNGKNRGSCGKLVKGMKSMLLPISPPGTEDQGGIKEDMIITQDDTPGELYCTGPNIMLGYLNEEQKTKEALIEWGGETWYRTGDLVLTRNGGVDFWHLARIKDLIWFKDKKGGEGEYSVGKGKGYTCVRPLVIETVLEQHEAVRECAVVGVKDERWGSVPRAFVMLKEGEWNDEEVREEVVRFSDLRAEEEYLHLKGGLEFVKQLPKNIA